MNCKNEEDLVINSTLMLFYTDNKIFIRISDGNEINWIFRLKLK